MFRYTATGAAGVLLAFCGAAFAQDGGANPSSQAQTAGTARQGTPSDGMSSNVASLVQEARKAISENRASDANADLAAAAKLPGRTPYDDFKISEAQSDAAALSQKTSMAQIRALQKVIASVFFAQETPAEQGRYLLNLLNEENDLTALPDDRIAKGKQLLALNYEVEQTLVYMGFAYLNKLDFNNAVALARMINALHKARGEGADSDANTLLKTAGAINEKTVARAMASFQTLIDGGAADAARRNLATFDLTGCSVRIDRSKLAAGVLLSLQKDGFGQIRWIGACPSGQASGAGVLAASRVREPHMTYQLINVPSGLDAFTIEDFNKYQLVDDVHENGRHYYLLPPEGTSGGTYPASYNLSSIPAWAQDAAAQVGLGILQPPQAAPPPRTYAPPPQPSYSPPASSGPSFGDVLGAFNQGLKGALAARNGGLAPNLSGNNGYSSGGATAGAGPQKSQPAINCITAKTVQQPSGNGYFHIAYAVTNRCSGPLMVNFCSSGAYRNTASVAELTSFSCARRNWGGIIDLRPGETHEVLTADINMANGGYYRLAGFFAACTKPMGTAHFRDSLNWTGSQLLFACFDLPG